MAEWNDSSAIQVHAAAQRLPGLGLNLFFGAKGSPLWF